MLNYSMQMPQNQQPGAPFATEVENNYQTTAQNAQMRTAEEAKRLAQIHYSKLKQQNLT